MPSTDADKNRIIRERTKAAKDRLRVQTKLRVLSERILALQNKEWDHILDTENMHLNNMRTILANMILHRSGGK